MAFTPRTFRKGTRTEIANNATEETNLIYDGWAPDDGQVYTPSPSFSSAELGELKAALVPFWAPNEPVAAGAVRMTALGLTIKRNSSGTTRASYDATESALWTVTSSGGGGGGAVSSVNGHTGEVVLSADDMDGFAPVATSGAYSDLTGKPTIPAAYTDEQAQDAAASLLTTGTHTGVSFTYDDAVGKLNANVTGGGGGGSGFGLSFINVKSAPYNAKGDGRSVWDASVTNGSPTLTSATAAFVAGDVGKTVIVANQSVVFTSTIASVQSATSVTMATNCTLTTGSPYALAIGTNDTAAIQQAIDAANAAGGGTVYLPAGQYIVAGPQVAGTVAGTGNSVGNNFTYSGQLLFPAVPYDPAVTVPIKLLGDTPPSGSSIQVVFPSNPSPSGSIILSNATSGNVFDSLPTSNSLSHHPAQKMTNVHTMFENLTVRAPMQPVTALNLSAVMSVTLTRCRIDVFYKGQIGPVAAGGVVAVPSSSLAVWAPMQWNYGIIHFTEVDVLGYGTGYRISDHAMFDGGFIQGALIGLQMDTADHINTCNNLCLQHVRTHIKPTAKTYLVGSLTVETADMTYFVDDNSGFLSGDLTVNVGAFAGNGSLPMNGGWNLNYRVLNRVANTYPTQYGLGWVGAPVRENFARLRPSTSMLHAAGISMTPWEDGEGTHVIGVNGGKGTPVSGWGTYYVVAPPTQRTYIQSRIQLSSGNSSIGVVARAMSNGNPKTSWFGVYMRINGATNEIGLVTAAGGTWTPGQVLSAAGLVAGSTYELGVLWDQPIHNGPAVLTVYLNGVQKLQYTLTSAEQVTFGAPSRVGLLLQPVNTEDMGSRWLDFYALPA